jgi:WD40 repeat protein
MKNDDSKINDDQLEPGLPAHDASTADTVSGDRAGAGDDADARNRTHLEDNRRYLEMLESVFPRTLKYQDATPLDLAPPDVLLFRAPIEIDGFEIRRPLGAGGHGSVWLAFDARLQREVAVKIPHLEFLLTPGLRDRFISEAQAAARLDHPNLIPVYEAGEASGACYLISAYCDGPTLAAWLKDQKGPADPRIAAAIVAAVADGVRHAHARGILHRDIKPSNVLLSLNNEGDIGFVPRLTDFGLAQVDELGNATRTGATAGTPAYMAPEQAETKFGKVGPATDIYALGVVLYELLTGCTPFQGNTGLETLQSAMRDEPKSPRRIRPKLSRDLEAVCLKCLEKRPSDRYASAAELAADLRRYLAGEPVLARRIRRWRRAGRWLMRRSTLGALAAAFLFGVVILGIGIAWHFYELRTYQIAGLKRDAEFHREARIVRQNQYVDDLRLAGELWAGGRRTEMLDILRRHEPKPGEEDLRCFVWHYLWDIAHRQPATMRHERGEVFHASFSRDGRTLATAGEDCTVRLWDVATRKEIGILRGHTDDVNWVSFSANGKRLATASDDHTLRVWDFADRREHARFTDEAELVCAEFSPDGKWLVGGGDAGFLRIWDCEHLREEKSFPRLYKGRIESLAYSPDGKTVATAGQDSWVHLWDIEKRTERRSIPIDKWVNSDGKSLAVAFSPDGRTLAAGGWNFHGVKGLVLLDAETGNLQREFHNQDLINVHSLVFAPDGKTLVEGGERDLIRIWDMTTGTAHTFLQGHTKRVWCVAFSPDGRSLVSTSRDGTIKLWDPGLNQDFGLLDQGSADISAVTFSPDGKFFAALDFSRKVKVWTAAPVQLVEDFSVEIFGDGLQFTPANKSLLVRWGSDLQAHHVYDVTTRRQLPMSVGTDIRSITKIAVSHGAREFATIEGSPQDLVRQVRLRDWATGSVLQDIWTCDKEIESIKFSPDDQAIIVMHRVKGSLARTVCKRADGVCHTSELRWLGGSYVDLALPPSGASFAIANGITIYICDSATGGIQKTLGGHTSEIRRLVMCPDGKILASASTDGTVKLWDLLTGREVMSFSGRRCGPIAFRPDGKTLVTTNGSSIYLRPPAATKGP